MNYAKFSTLLSLMLLLFAFNVNGQKEKKYCLLELMVFVEMI